MGWRSAAGAVSIVATLACGASARADAPSALQGGPSHSGFVPEQLTPPLGKLWVRDDLGALGSPIIHAGVVLVRAGQASGSGTASPTLVALDEATGRTLWSTASPGTEISAAGGLVVTRERTSLVARDVATGAVRWSASDVDDFNASEPVADGDLVLLGGPGITAYRLADGSTAWETSSANSATGTPAADADRAYVNGCGGGILAVRRALLGMRAWSVMGSCGGGSDPVFPVVAQGRVWGEEQVVAADSGAVLAPWTLPRPAVAADRTVTAERDGRLHARDFSGRELWSTALGAPDPSGFDTPQAASLPLIAGDTVYVRLTGAVVEAFSLSTGAPLWTAGTRGTSDGTTGNVAEQRSLAVRDGTLVTALGGKLIAFRAGADAPGVDPDPWRAQSAVSLVLKPLSKTKLVFGGTRPLLNYSFKRTVGQESPGDRLVLESSPFPFTSWTEVTELERTDLSNETVLRPERNTRYRLRYTGVSPELVTEPRQVDVDLRFDVAYTFLSPRRLRARVTIKGPADAVAKPRRIPFYFVHRGAKTARRIGFATVRHAGATVARGTTEVLFPRGAGRKDFIVPCLPDHGDDGFGPVRSFQKRCGAARL